MNKTELVREISKKTGQSLSATSATVDAFFEAVAEALKAGGDVRLPGQGVFCVRERAARKGHNPRTGEEIEISASRAPAFKPGKLFKDSI